MEESEESMDVLQKFTANYESYFETLVGGICKQNEPGCEEFKSRLGASKLERLEQPFIAIITMSKMTTDPLVYFYPRSKPVTKKSLKSFVKDFQDKNISYSEFSEPIPAKVGNHDVQKLVKNSMTDFFMSGFNKDLVVLFYDSRECLRSCTQRDVDQNLCNQNPGTLYADSMKCDKLVKSFSSIVEKVRSKNDPSGEHIRFGYFDLGKNSYHVYQIQGKVPLIRIYKLGKYNNFVDHVIEDGGDGFQSDMIHFLLDTTTEDLGLHEIDKEVEEDM